ncbi:DUF1059 domain-containing protein [Streptomyces pactum]|uniref:DUF1059 domain-containing protein n=1 Tax=Streptomyces pactum TaxID=68249 RepID=A0ABS0NP49_9ACTN|nr:DUF1059 domain-containing protein [Streptomyces pactum]MBH5336985.1 DUF1059 domain-containing protein [Streptomyces pactum]
MRKTVDCRDFPGAEHCTLTLSGEEEDVLRAATEHAVRAHDQVDSLDLRAALRRALRDAAPRDAA